MGCQAPSQTKNCTVKLIGEETSFKYGQLNWAGEPLDSSQLFISGNEKYGSGDALTSMHKLELVETEPPGQ